MRNYLILLCAVALLGSSCTPSISGILANLSGGQAIIQYADGSYSDAMTTKDAFAALKSNESIYFSAGKVKLTEPLNLENLENIKLVGSKTVLAAQIDMPVVTLKDCSNVEMTDLLIVHEIGEWCAQNCVEFYGASNIVIRDCNFDGSGYFGLALTRVTNAIIENNRFYNCEYGLAAWSSQNLMAKGNEFSDNRGADIQDNGMSQYSNDVMADNTFK